MQNAYGELIAGLVMSAILVFLVLVVNFQSWIQPAVAMSGLPIAIAGAAIGLFVTGTPLSVPALMGVMMVIGVSTANSVLVTSFARGLIADGHDPELAAYESAAVRLRPVLMTATAMILGIIPMAIGLGDGGEQNAPLGRAVIGGLLFGTPATLILVPSILAVVGRHPNLYPELASTLELLDRMSVGTPFGAVLDAEIATAEARRAAEGQAAS